MTLLRWAGAIALACLLSAPTVGQSYPQIVAPSNIVPPSGVAYKAADGSTNVVSPVTPLPVAGRQEVVALATANAAAPAVAVYGGSYVLNQGCTAYGSLTLRYRAADGATMLTLLSKTAADTAGGTLISLGTNTIVDVALSGTTGCNATLARIPS